MKYPNTGWKRLLRKAGSMCVIQTFGIVAATCILSAWSQDTAAQTSLQDKNLIQHHTPLVELSVPGSAATIAVAPAFQGKVMIANSDYPSGSTIGWINREALKSYPCTGGEVGGLERIWLGPLGSQFSLYYQQIFPLDEDNWSVPPPLATGSFKTINRSRSSIAMCMNMELTNYIGTNFQVSLQRKITLLNKRTVTKNLAVSLENTVDLVAYTTEHVLTNTGWAPWKKTTGLLGLWSANMLEGTPHTTVIIPLKDATTRDAIYTYFGPLDSTRLLLQNNLLYFKADGNYRSKIGIPPLLAPDRFASYSPEHNLLTVVTYQKTTDTLYFNSNVSIQKEPYHGEVIPIYNNGTMDYLPSATPTFYELESTSAMRPLYPGDSLSHQQTTYHFKGTPSELNHIFRQVFNTDLVKIPF
ncbi:DUF6786 family protein [Marinoscillum furvescens]|uniref:DUF4185 domain-containing protein n=1 Tax=Marinoscillum furvescens DSM 4134 TaxID=1122208 RepID=A0A3D9L1R6_MARFU|nr:DUF6786 family protein [Marinoscillum furvescens]RED96026.1 hypothetical protein C7460_11684 [Marinoscillum furvescens DSM 4134]